jgi:hypothetical protein
MGMPLEVTDEPEKRILSTVPKATRRSAKVERWPEIHRKAQAALRLRWGTVPSGVEKVFALRRIFDVGIDQQRVHLRMGVLDHNLETVEVTGPRQLGSRSRIT